jgi:hypothetical protein
LPLVQRPKLTGAASASKTFNTWLLSQTALAKNRSDTC